MEHSGTLHLFYTGAKCQFRISELKRGWGGGQSESM